MAQFQTGDNVTFTVTKADGTVGTGTGTVTVLDAKGAFIISPTFPAEAGMSFTNVQKA